MTRNDHGVEVPGATEEAHRSWSLGVAEMAFHWLKNCLILKQSVHRKLLQWGHASITMWICYFQTTQWPSRVIHDERFLKHRCAHSEVSSREKYDVVAGTGLREGMCTNYTTIALKLHVCLTRGEV